MIEGRAFRNVEARRRSFADSIDRYVEEIVPTKRDARTRLIRLRWWKEKLGRLKLAEVSPAAIIEARSKLARETFTRSKPESKRSTVKGNEQRKFRRSNATLDRYHAAGSHVFSVARREWQWVQHNPFESVGRLGEARSRVRFLSEEERARLLTETAKDPQLHTLVVLALATAARVGELVNLRWSDVDLKAGRLLLRVTKNAQERTAWVTGEALRLLKEHGKVRRLDDDRMFTSEKGKLYRHAKPFDVACQAARVEDFSFHGLRHSAATYLAREGASEQQLKAIGGWKSGVVSRYVHLAAADAKCIQRKMNEKILGK
ncbi:MAG TPA: site-specific integrase [Steroidobacteraceae bacterium]|nr:site-specific integrase [Steroidobacteraceae bacterium]